jgi:hypothetical protein
MEKVIRREMEAEVGESGEVVEELGEACIGNHLRAG